MNYYRIDGIAGLHLNLTINTEFEAASHQDAQREMIDKVNEYVCEIQDLIEKHLKSKNGLVDVELLFHGQHPYYEFLYSDRDTVTEMRKLANG